MGLQRKPKEVIGFEGAYAIAELAHVAEMLAVSKPE
jgi:hypothetical protein